MAFYAIPRVICQGCGRAANFHGVMHLSSPMVDPSAFLMDVIGSHRIIQHPQAEAFFCLIEPVIPVASILGKLQKKLFLVAAVGDVPHLSWTVDLLVPFLHTRFRGQKSGSKAKYGLVLLDLCNAFDLLAWSDPE
jgi:hypothetical protein